MVNSTPYKPSKKELIDERKGIASTIQNHIKSIQAGLKKYLAGSPSEQGYIEEHAEKLRYWVTKLYSYERGWGF